MSAPWVAFAVLIDGHDHQRSSLSVNGYCDHCWDCPECGPVACEDCPHWRTA